MDKRDDGPGKPRKGSPPVTVAASPSDAPAAGVWRLGQPPTLFTPEASAAEPSWLPEELGWISVLLDEPQDWDRAALQLSALIAASRCRHSRRVSRLAYCLARHLNLGEMPAALVGSAALFHDIGKVLLPGRLSSSPSKFDREKMAVMRCHTILGAALLAELPGPVFALARQVALAHHECWDGSGYPQRLVGEEIPLAARITSLADQYDALRSERTYKDPCPHDEACAVLVEGDGRTSPEHFDPMVLTAFDRARGDFELFFEESADGAF